MAIAGHSAAPATAEPSVLKQAAFVSRKGGGHGAVRELVEAVLAVRHAGSA
jgi:3-deoxy-D-manno-octulosonate 8-phosphate phosphatase KdsC-like HAD superfamily phosphatase